MEKIISVQNKKFERIPVKTHLISFGENLGDVMKKYVSPKIQKGDWVAISEKVVSVSQNNMRHISTVKAGWLAKLIVKGVKKYPNDIGFSKPEKMQLAVELSGTPRMLVAMIIGALGKIFGVRGLFWRIAGHRVSEIDGFNPASMYPYNEYAALPPKDPKKVSQDLENALGYPVIIIDGNNINVEVIAVSKTIPIDSKTARLTVLDNPMGQDNEMTPFIIVREIK